jgi:hypothetical protein
MRQFGLRVHVTLRKLRLGCGLEMDQPTGVGPGEFLSDAVFAKIEGEFVFRLTSRAVRACGAVALAVGAALAIPGVAMAGGPAPHGGTGCGYLHAAADNNSMFWKDCSNHEEWVQLEGVGDGRICVQAGEDKFVGYKVFTNRDGEKISDIRDAYLIADSCPPVGSPER